MPRNAPGANVSLDAEGATGSAVPSSAILIGGTDGTNLEECKVEDATNPNLRVGIYGGGNLAEVEDPATDAIATTVSVLAVGNKPYEFNGATHDRVRHSFYTEVTGITTSAAGTAIDISTTPMAKFTWEVERTAGANDFTVDLQGSLDNTAWYDLDTAAATSTDYMKHVVNKPVRYLRYNVTTIGAGNTVSIRILAGGR